MDWKRNLDIVITTKRYKNVLTTDCPKTPGPNASKEQKDKSADWKMVNEMARYYILTVMSSVLQHQHQSFSTEVNILINQKEMFRD